MSKKFIIVLLHLKRCMFVIQYLCAKSREDELEELSQEKADGVAK